MLEHLRKKMDIPASKFAFRLADRGNTVSSTIPITLRNAAERGALKPGDLVIAVGFGAGHSWRATLFSWGRRIESARTSTLPRRRIRQVGERNAEAEHRLRIVIVDGNATDVEEVRRSRSIVTAVVV